VAVASLNISNVNPLFNPTHGGAVGDARVELTDRIAQRQQALAVLTDAATVLGENNGLATAVSISSRDSDSDSESDVNDGPDTMTDGEVRVFSHVFRNHITRKFQKLFDSVFLTFSQSVVSRD
jgi:hypothetical protein